MLDASLCTVYFAGHSIKGYFDAVEAANVKRLTSQGWRRYKVEPPAVRDSGPMLAMTDLAGISHAVALKCQLAY